MKRLFLESLATWKGAAKRQPLLLSGARQVGKTHVLKEFGHREFSTYHYLNFEEKPQLKSIFSGELSAQTLIHELELRLNVRIDLSHDLLILDEIQECPQALTSLKYFSEGLPELAVCAAGSLLGLLLCEGSFPVGNVNRTWLGPLKFQEFLGGIGRERELQAYQQAVSSGKISLSTHQVLHETYRIFCALGGLPAVVKSFAENQTHFVEALKLARKEQSDVLKDYFDDIAKHSGKVRATDITKVLDATANQVGRNLDQGVLKFRFKGVLSGKSNYSTLSSPVEWLVRAGLIYKVGIADTPQYPLSAYTKTNAFKLYLFDTGILGALTGIPITVLYQDHYGTAKGAIAENMALQLLVNDSEHNTYSWQKNTAEIEYLLSYHDKLVPLEVKASHRTRARSLDSYLKRYKPELAVILSDNPIRFDSKRRILFCPNYFAEDLDTLTKRYL